MRKLAIIVVLAMGGCELDDPWTGTVQLDTPFELPYNGIATVEGQGLEITFSEVVSDSRPAYGENHVSPGRVVVQLKLETEAGGGTVVSLSTNWYDDNYPGTIDTLGFRLSLLGIEPRAATKGKRIPSKDYVAQIEVMEPWRQGTLNLFDTDSYSSYSTRLISAFPDDTMWVAGDSLVLPVQYMGGCKKHNIYLIGACPPDSASTIFMDISLLHESHGDSCEAAISETLKFDLAPLRTCGLAADSVDLGFFHYDFPTVMFGL